MALADIRQRPGVVLAAAILLHVALISAQVNTASGLPVLQVITFGSFSEVQRGTMAIIDGVRGIWTGYVALRQVQQENNSLKQETPDAAGAIAAGARGSAAHGQPAPAARTARPRQPRHRRRRSDRRLGKPGLQDRHHRQGIVGFSRCRHGGDLAGRCCRPHHPAEPARLESAAADRSQRRGWRAHRADARAGSCRRHRRRNVAHAIRAGHRRREDRRPGRDVGHRRHLSKRIRDRHDRSRRSGRRRVPPRS